MTYIQYSSQVMLPTRTRKYHKGAPREVVMLKFPTQHLWVTVWINTSHASIFTRQGGSHEVQLAPRPAEYSSLQHTVAIYARFSLGLLPRLVAPEVALIISSNCLRLLFWSLHGLWHGQIESPLVWQCGKLSGLLARIIWTWINKNKMPGDVFLEHRL